MSTPPRYRRLGPAERREQILDVNALFAERGYDEVLIEDIARAAGVTRGLVHHYFGGRKDVYVALLERLGGVREETLRAPVGRSGRARVADTVSRWLDWTGANGTIYLGTIAPGEDIADTDVRRVVDELMHRAVAQVVAFHADIAEDSARLRYALECWTGLNRAATRRVGCAARPPAMRRRAARLHSRARSPYVRRATARLRTWLGITSRRTPPPPRPAWPRPAGRLRAATPSGGARPGGGPPWLRWLTGRP